MNDDFARICLKEAHECADLHAKWRTWDRRWTAFISSLVMSLAFSSLACAIQGEFIGQAMGATFSFVSLFWLKKHTQDKTTSDFLVHRQTFLDMAAEHRGY